MSSEVVENFEEIIFCNIAKGRLIHNLINVFLNTGSNFYLYFFRKCSKQFLDYQDDTRSSIIHGLIKSQMSSLAKLKSLKILLIRDVNCNKPDGKEKFALDYLVEDNDCDCIAVLLQHSQNLKISDKCLSKAFQLRNKQEKAFKLLFTYAVKHNIAPYLTGISDGDTFLHDIMVQEKEKIPFKKWMGYFLSFSEININAVNNNGLTVLDLLFMNYERKKCKYTIELLIKYRSSIISNHDSLELPLFLLNQKTRSQQFKKEFFKYFSKKIFFSMYSLKRENWLSKYISTTDEVNVIGNKSFFSHKYLKLKHVLCLFTKLPYTSKKFSPNNNNTPIKLPNCEESEISFKISSIIYQENITKSSQKCITETAKAKKYLSSKEAIAYRNLIAVNNSETLQKCTQMTPESNNSAYESNDSKCREEKFEEESSCDSGYEEGTTGSGYNVEEFDIEHKVENKTDSNKSIQQLQGSSTVLCTVKNPWNNELLYQKCCIAELLNYRKLDQVPYGILHDVVCNGQPCVAKAVHPDKQFLKEINILSSLNHPNIIQFLGVHYHSKMPLLVMEKMQLNLSKWLETNPSSSLHSKVDLLTDVLTGLKYLHLRNVIHCNLNTNNILVHINGKAKISDFRMADKIGKNMIQLPGNILHMPPEVYASNPVYTEKLDIFSFGCVVIHTITHELPIVDTTSFCSEIDKRYKYLQKIKGFSQVYSMIIACLQDDPSCRPNARQLYHSFKTCLKFSPILLKDCVSEVSGDIYGKSYGVVYPPLYNNKRPGPIKTPEDTTFKQVHIQSSFDLSNFGGNHITLGLNRAHLLYDRLSVAVVLVKHFHLQNTSNCDCNLKMLQLKVNHSHGLWQLINDADITFHKMISIPFALQHFNSLSISGGLKGYTTVRQGYMCLTPYHVLLDGQNREFFRDKQFNKAVLPQLKLVHLDRKINKTVTEEPTQQETFPLLLEIYENSQKFNRVFLQSPKGFYKKDVELAATKFKSLGANLKCVPGKHKTQVSVDTEISPDPEALFSGLFYLWQYVIDADDNCQSVDGIIFTNIMRQFNSLGVSRMNQYSLVSKDVVYLVQQWFNLHSAWFLGGKTSACFKNKCKPKATPLVSCLLDMNRNIKELNISGKISNNCNPVISIQYLKSLLDAEREARFMGNDLRTTYLLREQVTKTSALHQIRSAKVIRLTAHGSSSAFTQASKNVIAKWKNTAVADNIKGFSIAKELGGCSLYKNQKDMYLLICNIAGFQGTQRTLQSVRNLPKDQFGFSGHQFIENLQFPMEKLPGKVTAFLIEEYLLQFKNLHSLKNKALVPIDELNYHDLPTIIGVLSTTLKVKLHDFEMVDKASRNIIQLQGNFSHILLEAPLSYPVYFKSLDTFSFGCMILQIIEPKVPAINITTFCCSKLPEFDRLFEKITPDESVNRVGAHHISYLETVTNETFYNSVTQSYCCRSDKEYDSLLNVQLIHFLALMHYFKFVPGFNWQMCELDYHLSYENICDSQKRMILFFYTIFQRLCKRLLLRRKWVFSELPPIPLLIMLTNKTLLHEGKLVNLLQHDLSLIDLFAKALLKNVKILTYTPIQLWSDIYEFCIVTHSMKKTVNCLKWVNKKEQEIENINSKAEYVTLHSLKNISVLTAPNVFLRDFNPETVIVINASTIDNATLEILCMGMQAPNTAINEKVLTKLHLCTTNLQTKSEINICDVAKTNNIVISSQGFTNFCAAYIACNSKLNIDYTITDELQMPYLNENILTGTEMINSIIHSIFRNLLLQEHCLLHHVDCHCMWQQTQDTLQSSIASHSISTETESEGKNNPWVTTDKHLIYQPTNSRSVTNDVQQLTNYKVYSTDDKTSIPCQVVNSSYQHNKDILYVSTTQRSHLHVFEESNSEASVDTCVNDLYESLDFRGNSCYVESESCDSLYRCANSDTLFLSNSFVESVSITGQESFQHFVKPSESISVSVIGQRIYSPLHAVPTIPCSNLSFNETVLQRGVLFKKENNRTRGFGDGSDSSSSDEDNNGEDKRGIHTSLVSHYHSPNPQQHSLPTDNPRYKSQSAAVNTSLTPQTSAGTSHISTKHDGRLREVATAKPFMGVGVTFPNSPAMYTSKGEYLINDSLTERGPILLDIPNGRNELVMAAYSTQSIPKLYPIVGLRKELPGIALPPPIPLDLPKIHSSKKVTNVASHQQVVREQPVGTAPGTVPGSNVQKPQHMASVVSHQQQAPLSQSMDFSDPVSIIGRAALFLTAGDYGATIKVLEVLDKHLVLPDDIDMAKEFGQGLANYKNLHYRAAKPCFNALFEKSINHRSPGNQAVASIYLGEIEMSWAKYKDAEKHFTLAVTNYNPDNVAEKFQQTILTKSAVLVKKGQCHRSLSQIKEAINAFKLAKEVAESAQEQARGSKLKTAKEDELSAVCALGNILQSIGDYEQSFEYYEKSLKLAGELGDHVSIGWAHGNLGNAMLGLDQKDKALDHLITAFHMSARYEGNPLAVGRAVSNLGNAYQAIGNLEKAKEHYELALGHAIYGNDLQGQGRACGNIGNVYMLLKEPVKAVHYYTETLRLSTDRNTKITGHHNRGCARFDVAECIIQGKKPKELVPATTQDSEYGRLAIKLTDEVITTDPVQETKPNREPSAQSISEQKESSMSAEMLPVMIKGKVYEGTASVEIVRMAEAMPFLETAQRDLLEAIDSHEQGVQNVKGSHEALSLSLSLFESNSRSFYKMQETLVELGKLCQRLSELRLMDMAAAQPQEFKDALVYGEQARARTLGELVLQKKKTVYSDLFSISTPLTIQVIYKTVKLQKFPVVFLSYCVSKLLMWILVPVNDEVIIRCQSMELKEEDLENSSFELYIRYNLLQFLSKDEIYIFRRCAYEQESPFTVLHDVIAIKIIEGLKSIGCSEVTEFIVIPDSVTHLLPFSPLMNKSNWQFFGDKYRVRIVPSFLSLLVMSMTSNPVVEIPGDKGDFLIVGNPTIPAFMYDSTQWNLGRLPYAEKEAISVASIIGAIPVLREQATKQSVLYRLRSAKVIHLATHGSASAGFLAFTSSFPVSKSGLAEKEHILIFPKEIETLNISPALVVLSSCDSARGQVKAEGVIGMARAFLSAGAHSVLVSLWRVPDESANVFMNFFYQFLVNGLPSLQALQRSMQCLRCFLKYSHYVHWSGFQIIGKEVTFHKDSNAQFPIQKLLGEVSIFPRQHVKIIEENLLGIRNKIFTDVQLLVGTPGNEPEECARDFIKNCYYYYPCGVYWYDASNRLLLETTMKVAHETPLMGGVYKEQKELDPLPTISNPSLLTTKGSKPSSRKEKKLIVLQHFTSLETCACIMREMKDAATDIIIVSNELFCKEEIAKEFDKYFNRGCNIIEVTNLQHISIMQRMVYGLLEKNSFVARDADHIVFTLLSEYSRGAATIVHLLTSLMQKSDDNSRTGFELAKQQLKFHMAHQKLKKDLNSYGMQNTLSIARSIGSASENMRGDIMTEMKPQIDHASDDPNYGSFSLPRGLEHPNEMFDVKTDDNKKQSSISNTTSGLGNKNDEVSELPIIIGPESYTSGFVSMSSKNDGVSELPILINPESYTIPEGYKPSGHKPTSSSNEPISIHTEGKESVASTGQSTSSESSSIHGEEVEESVITSTSQPTGDKQTMASSIIKTITSLVAGRAGSDDSKQTASSDTTLPPTTAKPGKESLDSTEKHPLYLYINDILSTTRNISLPAHHLLNSLAITGPIPLPLFYVEELDNVVMSAVFNKEKRRIQAESPMKQLMKEGVIRRSCYPIVYHKDLDTDYIDLSIQQMFVPKLLCDAVTVEMDDTDKVLAVLSVQCALENLLTDEIKPSLIHLRYILILCNQLHDVCSQELHEFGDQLHITNQKIKLQVSLNAKAQNLI